MYYFRQPDVSRRPGAVHPQDVGEGLGVRPVLLQDEGRLQGALPPRVPPLPRPVHLLLRRVRQSVQQQKFIFCAQIYVSSEDCEMNSYFVRRSTYHPKIDCEISSYSLQIYLSFQDCEINSYFVHRSTYHPKISYFVLP